MPIEFLLRGMGDVAQAAGSDPAVAFEGNIGWGWLPIHREARLQGIYYPGK